MGLSSSRQERHILLDSKTAIRAILSSILFQAFFLNRKECQKHGVRKMNMARFALNGGRGVLYF